MSKDFSLQSSINHNLFYNNNKIEEREECDEQSM
jgi:hypothetical protein